jgi:hypothetical protein
MNYSSKKPTLTQLSECLRDHKLRLVANIYQASWKSKIWVSVDYDLAVGMISVRTSQSRFRRCEYDYKPSMKL